MKNLHNFLSTKEYHKDGRIRLVIAADPAIGTAGWSIVARSDNHTYGIEAGVINAVGQTKTERLQNLYVSFDCIVKTILTEINRHNYKELKTFQQIELIGAGLEIPVFFGSRMRIKRDLTQRESISMMRLVFAMNNIPIAGETDEKYISPGQVHDLAGVSRKKDTDEFNKKDAVYAWLKNNIKLLYDPEKGADESDAYGIGVVALDMLLPK